MNPESPIEDKKATDLLFREEVVCDLIGSQHLTTRINFSTPDAASMLWCHAEMHLGELDFTVHLQHSLHATGPQEIMDCRIALGELLIEKMLAELQTVQTHFSELELFHFDGLEPVQPEQLSPVPFRPKAAGGYLSASMHHRNAGGYLPSAHRNAGGYLPSTRRNAGGYLPSSSAGLGIHSAGAGIHSAGAAIFPAGLGVFPGGSGVPFTQTTIRTNYSSIEQHATRLLHLKEAIRGMFHLQHQRH